MLIKLYRDKAKPWRYAGLAFLVFDQPLFYVNTPDLFCFNVTPLFFWLDQHQAMIGLSVLFWSVAFKVHW